ncbi:uncharacterized protein C4orf45 homolog isoform X2 [Papio anubis]|uniref:uncharacterized protein C4orf45 homolog isoform X2 n=1 Tax=Papio anubis TaxID=9555 RepID=UPI000B7B0154|nr:uncharacterized protein C4orf45 homolog isoform X2 [Papio anubis]
MASVTYQKPTSTTVGKQMIFTGPDYIKDYLPKIHQHTCYVGEQHPALEKTGDLRYLWRPASNRSLPAKYKHEYVGEIGWGVPQYNFINKSRLESGFHIKYEELSQASLDSITHRYQNPWNTASSCGLSLLVDGVGDQEAANPKVRTAKAVVSHEDQRDMDFKGPELTTTSPSFSFA